MMTHYSPNIEIPARFIIEVGMCRKRGVCALCENRIEGIPKHNIQLCLKCRRVEFKKFCLEMNKKDKEQ